MRGLMVVVWVELNWLQDVAGSAFLVKRDARKACAAFSEWEAEWTSGRGWGISAALDAWSERLSFLVV